MEVRTIVRVESAEPVDRFWTLGETADSDTNINKPPLEVSYNNTVLPYEDSVSSTFMISEPPAKAS